MHSYHHYGVFASRSRMRRLLPPQPRRQEGLAIEGVAQPLIDIEDNTAGKATSEPTAPTLRHRLRWAQLLRRLLHIEALSCPRCSTPLRTVPMVVLAFLTDPAVVEKILRHLGFPHAAPALAPARSSPWQSSLDPLLPPLLRADVEVHAIEEDAPAAPRDEESANAPHDPPRIIRPPP